MELFDYDLWCEQQRKKRSEKYKKMSEEKKAEERERVRMWYWNLSEEKREKVLQYRKEWAKKKRASQKVKNKNKKSLEIIK